MTTIATVDPITDDTPWNAHAVLGDALNRCSPDSKVMVLWLNKEGHLSYSKNTDNVQQLSTLNTYLTYLCHRCLD